MSKDQGAHYKVVEGEQHHVRAIRLNLNWYQANITKYAERAPHKGQAQEDLIKVIDYAVMYLMSYTMPPLNIDQERRIKEIISKLDNGTEAGPEYVEQN